MKRLLIATAIVAAALSAYSKKGNTPETPAGTPSDTAEKQAETAPEPELLVTPDLTFLEVKGNVKEIVYVSGKKLIMRARFDKNGNLTHYGINTDDKISEVKRNDKGQLIEFVSDDWKTVTWRNDRPAKVHGGYVDEPDSYTYVYTYDDQGLVNKIDYLYYSDIEDTTSTTTGTVTYPADAFDDNGNWLRRTVAYPDRTEKQERQITYYAK